MLSSLSWLVATGFAVLTVLTLPLMQPPLEAGVILMFVLSVAQAAILCVYALAFRPSPSISKASAK